MLPQDTWVGAVSAAGAVFAVTWLLAFIYRFFEAAAGLYYEQKKLADALAFEFQPKVRITGPDILTHPKGALGRAVRTIRIRVENESAQPLKKCSIREVEFVNRFGQRSGMQRYFRLAEESYADMSAHSFGKTFDLRGKGESQLIDIAYLDETEEDSRVIMLYATQPTSPTPNAITRDCFPHMLTVSFTADDVSFPEKRVFRISISDSGLLEMAPVEERGKNLAPSC
jgi:hypothetical protein